MAKNLENEEVKKANSGKAVKAEDSAGKGSKKDKAKSKSKDKKKTNKVVQYFRDLKAELGKVVWPTRSQVTNNTIVVLTTIVVMGLFVGALDAIFSGALQFIIGLGS